MYPVAIVFSPYTLWTVARSVESFAQRFPQRTIGKGDCALVRVAFFNLSRTNYCVSAEKEREREIRLISICRSLILNLVRKYGKDRNLFREIFDTFETSLKDGLDLSFSNKGNASSLWNFSLSRSRLGRNYRHTYI